MLKPSGLFPKEMQNSNKEAWVGLRSVLLVPEVPNGSGQGFCLGRKLPFNFFFVRTFYSVSWELLFSLRE